MNPTVRPDVVPLSGVAHAPFEPLADVFARVVAGQGRGGAALAVYHRGELAVDLVAGSYRDDSLQYLFSVTKSITAVACAIAHRDGLIDLDAPLADCWPAFRRASTARITLRSVLSHRSGLAAFDGTPTLDELLAGADEALVERQEPYWEPDTAHGYHAFTFGTLVDGAFRRAIGRTVGDFVRERIAEPLGLDLWIGTPQAVLGRVEPVLYSAPQLTPGREAHLRQCRVPPSVTSQLSAVSDIYNDPRVAQASWPATSGIAGARDLARMLYATLGPVDGVQLLDEPTRDAMTASRSHGPDVVLGVVSQFASGMQLPFPQLPLLGPRSYGHEAAGGSAVVADPDLDLALGFTTNVFPAMMGASLGFLALLPTVAHCVRVAAS